MLAVGLSADTGESVTVNNALEAFTLRGTDHVNKGNCILEDVLHCDDIAELELSREIVLELCEFLLGSGSCLFEMALKSLAGVLFCSFVIGKLYSGITIFFNCTELRNNARTSLDDGARYILAVGTENGSHSDFLSN